jgi:hypothetical protein
MNCIKLVLLLSVFYLSVARARVVSHHAENAADGPGDEKNFSHFLKELIKKLEGE